MNNPQLLDYIRQQLSINVSKEDISKALIANGWQAIDINEAFAVLIGTISISQPPVPFPIPMKSQEESNPILKKSVWYRLLQSSVIVSGTISLIATALALAGGAVLGGMEGGWAAGLILAIFIGPVVTIFPILCGVLFVLYCILYFLKWRKEGYLFGKVLLIVAVLSMLILPAMNFSARDQEFSNIKQQVMDPWHTRGSLTGDKNDSDSIIRQKYLLHLIEDEMSTLSFKGSFATLKSFLEGESLYQHYVPGTSCGEGLLYHISSQGNLAGVFLKRCDNSDNYFCVGQNAISTGPWPIPRGDVSLAEVNDQNYFCGAQ